MSDDERAELHAVGIELVDEPVGQFLPGAADICVQLAESGRVFHFDTIYAALGLRGRSELATPLGVEPDEDGMLIVDQHQRTSVPGIYAIGDVVQGLTQIDVALGQAAIAASTINGSLERRLRPSLAETQIPDHQRNDLKRVPGAGSRAEYEDGGGRSTDREVDEAVSESMANRHPGGD